MNMTLDFNNHVYNHHGSLNGSQQLSKQQKVHEIRDNEVGMGTTLIALKYADGVVVGADSRTSSGSYIVNRVSDKLTRITDRIYCCRSGSAADTQALADAAAYELDFLRHNLGCPVTVDMAANVLKNMAYNYRDQLTVGLIVAGWDATNKGSVYSIPLGGMMTQQNFAVGGSGSIYVQGLIDKTFGGPNKSKEECVDYLKSIIFSAIARDAASGGVVRIAAINKDGVERFLFMSDDHEPISLKQSSN
ncbi:unnamed protein product [Gordionus sp. m RMFG-2023]|uniref:uncharacterized protein LOC135923667 n=1 Tax=Gordionus sp. m RMFG-2023 TaxID=3053472 RepID=UPI0030DF0EC4